MLKRKFKMINFRVSPDVYHKLHDACVVEGVGSISELARLAIDSIIRRQTSPQPIGEELVDLRQRAAALAADIERLTRNLDVPAPDKSNYAVTGD